MLTELEGKIEEELSKISKYESGTVQEGFKGFVEKSLTGRTSQLHPKIYIMYGPPASGKGRVLGDLGIADFVNVNLDDIIQNNIGFIEDINQLGCKQFYAEYSDKCDVLPNKKDKIKLCSDVYMKYKNSGGDNWSTVLFLRAVHARNNIVYETTGRSVDWFISNDLPILRKAGYEFIIIYPLVKNDILFERSCQRARKHGRYISPEFIKSISDVAPTNLQKMISILKEFGIKYELHLYDNNAVPTKIDFIMDTIKKYTGGGDRIRYLLIILIVLLIILILYYNFDTFQNIISYALVN